MSITDLLADTPAVGPHPYATGNFLLGVVRQNDEKKHAAMVRVEFTAWKDGKNISKWIPVLSAYAGKAYGRYWIPEVDDIVLVGFIGPEMERPFVLGSFYPADAALPGEQFHEKNSNRHIKTKGGIMVTLSDEADKQSAVFETPKGLTVRVEDESECITVSDKDKKNLLKVDSKNGALEITAEKKITMKAGKCTITIDGNAGSVAIDCDDLKMTGKQSAKLASNTSTAVEGGTLKLEGKQTAALKGASMTEVSGGILKLN